MNRAVRLVLIVAVIGGLQYMRSQRHRGAASSLPSQLAASPTLAAARQAHPTRLTRKLTDGGPLPVPPADVFDVVHYPAAAGSTSAYLTPDPGDGRRHPAIVWITGGDCNSIGEAWATGRAGPTTSRRRVTARPASC